MDGINELKKILGVFFDWNKSRLDCFSRMLTALFAVRTVNLREMAVAISSNTQIDSRHKRLKRFFKESLIDNDLLARFIFRLFFPSDKKVYLTIDRTNWFFGKSKINVLMIGVAYEGMALPLLWNLLNKAGNASAQEHIDILRRFISIFGSAHIEGVLGDREFASGKLFKWLNKKKIPFYIRIKEDSLARITKKKICKAKKIFNDLKLKEKKHFDMAVEIFGQKLYLAGSRSHRGELMIVATNKFPANAVAIYLRRWEIESLFQGLKGRGFRFEETRITHLERIDKLISLLAIGFCWAHKIGEWRALIKPIVLNKYRDSFRPKYSYFRYGFDLLREAILQKRPSLKKYVKMLFFPIEDFRSNFA